MKKYFSFILVLFVIFALFGCGNEITSGEIIKFDETQAKETILKVWVDDTDGKLMEEIKPAFEAANPGIIVEYQHMATVDSREKLKTYGRSGYGADVFQFPHDHMAQAILDDLVYVLPDSLMEKLEENCLPVAMKIAESNYDEKTGTFTGTTKKLFAVPISIESVVIYYNKDLLQSEGIDLPKTMEELLKISVDYKEKHGNYGFAINSHWADAYFLQAIYGAFGWTPFGKDLNDQTEVGFEKAESKAAIKWMLENLKPGTTGNGNTDSIQGTSLFEEGKIPFLLSGPWSVPGLKTANINFGTMLIPTINGNQATTFAGAQMLAVYKYSKNIEAAVKFVEFMATKEAGEILYRTSGDCPALKEEIINEIPGIKDDESIQVMLEQLSSSVPMPTIPQVTYYWAPAETMMKNLWNKEGNIDEEVAKAEKSYKASRDLAS